MNYSLRGPGGTGVKVPKSRLEQLEFSHRVQLFDLPLGGNLKGQLDVEVVPSPTLWDKTLTQREVAIEAFKMACVAVGIALPLAAGAIITVGGLSLLPIVLVGTVETGVAVFGT